MPDLLHWSGSQHGILAIVALGSSRLQPVHALFSFRTCMQVYLPSALTGGPQSSDPKVREVNNELNEVNRKILNNDLEIPPEGERSPSPEPIYDRNGMYCWRSCPASLHSSAH